MDLKSNFYWNGLSRHALVVKSEVAIDNVKRDQEEISEFGIDEAFMTSFRAKLDTLINATEFQTLRADKSINSAEIKEKRKALIQNIQKMKRKFELVFPKSSKEYKSTMYGNLWNASTVEFPRMAIRIAQEVEKHLPQLAKVSITAENITSLRTDIVEFETVSQKSKTKFKSLNFNAARDRKQAMTEVYNDLNQICKAGKALWIDDNYAKYADYVIILSRF